MIHILSGVFAVGTILFAVPFLMNQQSLPESTSPLPTTPREIVSIAAHDTLVYWFDDVQSDPGNILERPDTRTLPETEACEWVRRHSEEASQAVITAMTTEFHLGWAVLAGFLDIRSLLPVIIEKWTRIEDDVAYNGETPIEGRADLSYFRALQGIAFVIEHLAEKPLKQAVRLTPSQRKRLQARAKLGDEAALAILDAVN